MHNIQIEDLQFLMGAPDDVYAQGYSGSQTLEAFAKSFYASEKERYGLRPIEASSFLDLGSGHGAIVAQAQIMGFKYAAGIEIDPRFVELSKGSLSGLGFEANICQGDYFSDQIAQARFAEYALQDIDYFYVYEQSTSFQGLEHGQAVFERLFARYAKQGAVLIPVSFSPYHKDNSYLARYGCEKLMLHSGQHIIRKCE